MMARTKEGRRKRGNDRQHLGLAAVLRVARVAAIRLVVVRHRAAALVVMDALRRQGPEEYIP